MSVDRGGTACAVSGTTASTGLYSSSFSGVVDYRGEAVGYPATRLDAIPGVSASSPGLALNIGHNTTTSVTFTINRPVSSVQIPILDITRASSTSTTQAYRYIDTVAFSEPTQASGETTLLNRTTAGAGETYFRTGQLQSSGTVRVVTFTTTSSGPVSSITLTYTAPQAFGWEFIALGNPSFCV